MDLESVILSEVRKRKTLYANTYIWNLKRKKNGTDEPSDRAGIKT